MSEREAVQRVVGRIDKHRMEHTGRRMSAKERTAVEQRIKKIAERVDNKKTRN